MKLLLRFNLQEKKEKKLSRKTKHKLLAKEEDELFLVYALKLL